MVWYAGHRRHACSDVDALAAYATATPISFASFEPAVSAPSPSVWATPTAPPVLSEPLTPAPQPAVAGDVNFDVDISVEFKDQKQTLNDLFEVAYLRRLVVQQKGNISQCAKVAGLTRYHLRELLKKHGIKARE